MTKLFISLFLIGKTFLNKFIFKHLLYKRANRQNALLNECGDKFYKLRFLTYFKSQAFCHGQSIYQFLVILWTVVPLSDGMISSFLGRTLQFPRHSSSLEIVSCVYVRVVRSQG